MPLHLAIANLTDPAITDLLAAHHAFCLGSSPAESTHFLTASGLDQPEVTVWAAWDGKHLAGMGALKAISPTQGEVKSMHTAAGMRGKGVAGKLLDHIQRIAAQRGYHSLWLETGTMLEFAAARGLYERNGFTQCSPFGDYKPDRNSAFYFKQMTVEGRVQ